MGHCPAEGWVFGGARPARFGHRRRGALKPGCARCSLAGDREHPARTQVSILSRCDLRVAHLRNPGVLGERGGNWEASWAARQAPEDVRTRASSGARLLPPPRPPPSPQGPPCRFDGGANIWGRAEV
ncbi:hypothetical protein mRhiFer1_009678 [Rhinolophus ferrumequinum]|uniref:Uncharacterized protein n=1 Tax=Rhinolophus ferrumequinum TaxID=59479 RepID=A0A7J7R284_RHIFE|nr:hypothetical protein mRhiFer1_009678 [Rhinolophus ferrumequinum]